VSIAQALRRLGLVAAGGNYQDLHRRIAELGLDTSHMLGQAWLRGRTNPHVRRRSLDEMLVLGGRVYTNDLKKRLIREGIKEAKCECCGLTEWNGQPIPLELDHINGRRDDNRLENLQLLCPNCHAQTPTYRGRNIGKAR
jgi:5-methylcytosine-specific restriction endonuclease McrA